MRQNSFQFLGYKIFKSTLINSKNNLEDSELGVDFLPKGEIDKVNSTFTLFLQIIIKNEDNSISIDIESNALFKFESSISEIDKNTFFYINAIPILFPYIRSYIGTLTMLSGFDSAVLLPTMNLTTLGEELKKSTIEV